MRLQPRYSKGDRIGGRYQVHQALMGGMGEVYLCLDLEEIQPYALKTFQQRIFGQSSALRQTFEQEVLTWVGLEKHPNIVRCFHMDTLDNLPFMVLEWVAGTEGKGTDLRGWLRQGPLPLETAVDFAIDICYGLMHAQEKQPGIVHRDLKPENILMAQGGLAKITDFGLAQMAAQFGLEINDSELMDDESLIQPQQSMIARRGVAGTPPYMPPEQWQPDAALDVRADIYALGCILFEMLTGRLPFRVDVRPTTPDTYRQWLRAWEAQHAHAGRLTIPDSLSPMFADLLSDCLARNRDARPAQAADLLQRLQQVETDVLQQPRRLAPATGEFSAVDYNNRGITYADLGRTDAAIADFSHAIRINPEDATGHYNRGNTYRELGQFNEAISDYTNAINIDSDYASAYSNRGVARESIGNYMEAISDYTRAIQIKPQLAEAFVNRGAVYNNFGRYQKAINDYTQAIHLNPNYANAYYNRANTYVAINRHEEAFEDYSHAISLNKRHTQSLINRGALYNILGRPKKAIKDLACAIEINPNNANAYFNRGTSYESLGLLIEAITDFNHAIRLNPEDAQAYINLGALLGNQGNYREALPYFEKAAELGHPQGAQYAAQARRMLGEATPNANLVQQAFEAFRQTTTSATMRDAVAQFPFMTDSEFLSIIQQVIEQQVPPEHRPAFEQRLQWLRDIAANQ